MKSKLLIAISLTCLLMSVSSKGEQSSAFLDVSAILAGWEANYGYMESMEVDYCEKVSDIKATNESSELYQIVKFQYVERLESGSKYRIKYSMDPEGFEKTDGIMQHAFNGTVTQDYYSSTKSGLIINGLMGRDTETKNDLKHYLLLNEYSPPGVPSKPAFLSLLTGIKSGSDIISGIKVNNKIETINGEKCHLIEYEKNKDNLVYNFKIWVAHEKGMLPMKFTRSTNFNGKETGSGFEVKSLSFVETESGKKWYPKSATRYQNGSEGRIEYEMSVLKFAPNVKTTKEDFSFKFPTGTIVSDRILNLEYTIGVNGIDSSRPIIDSSKVPGFLGPDSKPKEKIENPSDTTTERKKMINVAAPEDANKEHLIDTQTEADNKEKANLSYILILSGIVLIIGVTVVLKHKRGWWNK